MRIVNRGGLAVLGLIALCAALSQAAWPERGVARSPTRQQLIGVWRLASIEYRGPGGSTVDPFYQADSTGIIIYDASGWMSVHIVAPRRQAWDVPVSRLSAVGGLEEEPLKAAAFDSYYAYFGTWDLDEAASVVTHHVKSSLIPAETGLDYAQSVKLENGHLVFTVRGGKAGEETVRKKVWERVPGR
jgi:Lipocalin-like domain